MHVLEGIRAYDGEVLQQFHFEPWSVYPNYYSLFDETVSSRKQGFSETQTPSLQTPTV